MTRKKISLLLLLSFLLALAAAATVLENPHDGSPLAAPPKTTVNEVKETVQGTEIVDPYRWLEDQDSPETRAWIDAQNAYSDGILAKLPGREAIRRQVSALIKIDTMSSPLVTNNRYFFTKRQADQDQSSLFLRKGLNGKDELLIDPLPMSARHTVTVNLMSVSEDGALLAYGVREGGADEVTPHLFDVDTRKDLADVFPKARYSGFSILNDKSGVYLTRDTAGRPARLLPQDWHGDGQPIRRSSARAMARKTSSPAPFRATTITCRSRCYMGHPGTTLKSTCRTWRPKAQSLPS